MQWLSLDTLSDCGHTRQGNNNMEQKIIANQPSNVHDLSIIVEKSVLITNTQGQYK